MTSSQIVEAFPLEVTKVPAICNEALCHSEKASDVKTVLSSRSKLDILLEAVALVADFNSHAPVNNKNEISKRRKRKASGDECKPDSCELGTRITFKEEPSLENHMSETHDEPKKSKQKQATEERRSTITTQAATVVPPIVSQEQTIELEFVDTMRFDLNSASCNNKSHQTFNNNGAKVAGYHHHQSSSPMHMPCSDIVLGPSGNNKISFHANQITDVSQSNLLFETILELTAHDHDYCSSHGKSNNGYVRMPATSASFLGAGGEGEFSSGGSGTSSSAPSSGYSTPSSQYPYPMMLMYPYARSSLPADPETYRRYRVRNNEASRRSRISRKLRHQNNMAKLAQLRLKNDQLRLEIEVMQLLRSDWELSLQQIQQDRKPIVKHEADKPHLKYGAVKPSQVKHEASPTVQLKPSSLKQPSNKLKLLVCSPVKKATENQNGLSKSSPLHCSSGTTSVASKLPTSSPRDKNKEGSTVAVKPEPVG